MRRYEWVAATPFLAVVLLACGSTPASNPVREAFAERPAAREYGTPVAFRFPVSAGGSISVHLLPGLQELSWRLEAPGLAIDRVPGFSMDEDEVYLLSPGGELFALDLMTGRPRTVDTVVSLAALGPTGTPHLVRLDGTIASVQNRRPVSWTDTLAAHPDAIWGAGRGRLLVEVRDEERSMFVLSANQEPVRIALPDGLLATSMWGDVIAIGTDSGPLLIDPAATAEPVHVRTERPVTALAFSPSAHRIYVVEAGGHLADVDRFGGRVLSRIQLPGEADAIRADPMGRLLLVKQSFAETIWIVRITELRVEASVSGSWAADLPAVATDGTVLLRQGDDIVALALDSLQPTGRVFGGAGDRWLAVAWDPRRPTLDLAEGDDDTEVLTELEIYVQVSSTSNEAWAEDAARGLRQAGMNATVLRSDFPDDGYRVVLGPYPTREAAEDIGRKLGRPCWIFTREAGPSVP